MQDWRSKLAGLLPDDYEPEQTEQKKVKQHFEIELDKKGRCGKQATLILGFIGSDEELKDLAATLKKQCSVGGSARGGEILIQGDFRQKIAEILKNMGHAVKVKN